MLENKLAIDTCIFTEMINYSITYKSGGYDALSKLIVTNNIKLSYLKNSILNMFCKDFVDENADLYNTALNSNTTKSNYALSTLLEKYKDYSKKIISFYQQTQKRLIVFINHLKNERITSIEKNDIDLKIKDYQNKLFNIQAEYNKFASFDRSLDSTIKNYNSTLNALSAGELYQDSLNGKVELVILPTISDEIINHTDLPEKAKIQEFSFLDIFNLLKSCKHYSTKSDDIVTDVLKLSRFMRPIFSGAEFANIPNNTLTRKAVESNAMAEAIVYGVNFVTFNTSLYIRDMSIPGDNDAIRQRIIHTASKYFPGATVAQPYSLGEVVQGLAKNQPTTVKNLELIDSLVYNSYLAKKDE